jgi:MFS family permease
MSQAARHDPKVPTRRKATMSVLFGTSPLSPAARKTILAGCIGFAVDFFDIYLPVLVLATAIGYFEPPGLSATTTTTIYFLTFAATLLGRPVGAIMFGRWADRAGRRLTTMVSIFGFGLFTLLIGCLPGNSSIGIWSLILLIGFRFVAGIFMGGEYTSNNTLALEMVPKDRRGLVGGILQGAYPIGFFFVSVVAAIMLTVTTKEQYFIWGWRIPFFLGAALAFGFLYYYYQTVPESDLWVASTKSRAPLKELMSGSHRRSLVQIMIMMLGFWFASQTVVGVMPGMLIQHLHIPSTTVTYGLLITSFVQFFAFVGFGLLGQAVGRRTAIVIGGCGMLIGGGGLYIATVSSALSGASPVITTALACLCYLLVQSPWGIVTTYLCERFPTHLRASGYGIGYSLAVVIPAFSGIYLLAFKAFMPYDYTPVILLVAAGGLVIIGALMGPETRQVEFTANGPDLLPPDRQLAE